MKRILFLLIPVFIFGCQKSKPVPLDEGGTCNNTTSIIPDSLTALITQVSTGVDAQIIRVQNSHDTILVAQTGYDFWSPSISPDKTKFICFRSSGSNAVQIDDYTTAEMWLFNIDGTNGHMITKNSLQGLNSMGMAKWAPDGLHIVFAGEKMETDGHNHWNIYLTDTNGIAGTKMNTRLGSFKYPAFANGDMTKITYQAWIVGVTESGSTFDTELFYANVDGSYQLTGEQRLTNNGQVEYAPTFSPDNVTIIYSQTTSNQPNTAVTLCTVIYSSSTTAEILNNHHINENAVWCTTNNKIYYSNVTSSWCIHHVNRIDAGVEQPVYRLMNKQLYSFDIK
jgi:Tol biopolymer transport system component